MTNLLSKNCKLVNIVWVERGILLTLIYYITKYYDELRDKKIIVHNEKYCYFLKKVFPSLKFQVYKEDSAKNFYFNIRRIIKKQDIVIDYLINYDDIIPSSKVKLVPWYDMNDPLIVYKYSKQDTVLADKYKKFITDFSKCRRSNIDGNLWDSYMEKDILSRYTDIGLNDFNKISTILNDFLVSNYTNTTNYAVKKIPYPVVYYNDDIDKKSKGSKEYNLMISYPNSSNNKNIVQTNDTKTIQINADNEQYKTVNEQLKAENDKLKEEIDKLGKLSRTAVTTTTAATTPDLTELINVIMESIARIRAHY